MNRICTRKCQMIQNCTRRPYPIHTIPQLCSCRLSTSQVVRRASPFQHINILRQSDPSNNLCLSLFRLRFLLLHILSLIDILLLVARTLVRPIHENTPSKSSSTKCSGAGSTNECSGTADPFRAPAAAAQLRSGCASRRLQPCQLRAAQRRVRHALNPGTPTKTANSSLSSRARNLKIESDARQRQQCDDAHALRFAR